MQAEQPLASKKMKPKSLKKANSVPKTSAIEKKMYSMLFSLVSLCLAGIIQQFLMNYGKQMMKVHQLNVLASNPNAIALSKRQAKALLEQINCNKINSTDVITNVNFDEPQRIKLTSVSDTET